MGDLELARWLLPRVQYPAPPPASPRPRLVGGHGTMPPLATFVALFGGVEVFGLAGLIVGPLLMSISIAILRIFAKDSEERRARGERHV